MFRIATLLEKREDSSLEVCVGWATFRNKKEAKCDARNTNSQTSRGSICFYDARNTKQIITDFTMTYRTPMKIGDNNEMRCSFARYGKHLTIIPSAFVEYFSKRQKDFS